MSVLRSLEEKIAGLVEGGVGRVFRWQVRPVELERKLAREIDAHKTVSVSRTYVPNEYAIWLSPEDRQRYEGVEQEVIDELSAYLLEHARRERLALVSRPVIEFRTDDRLHLGEFGIQARLVRPEGESAKQADHGHTMVYSTSDRTQESLSEARADRAGRAILRAEGRRLVIAPGGAVVGRSPEQPAVYGEPAQPPADATGLHSAATAMGARDGDFEPRLVVERAPGHTPGMEYDIGEGAVMGRGDQAEIRLEDPFASSRHAK